MEGRMEGQVWGEWEVFPTAVSTIVIGEERYQNDICLKHNYFSSSAGLRLCCVAVMAFPWLNGEDRPVSHAKTPIVECRNGAYSSYSYFFSTHTGFAHC